MRTLAEISSVPDIVIAGAVVLVAAFIAIKIVSKLAKLLAVVLIAIAIYVWVS